MDDIPGEQDLQRMKVADLKKELKSHGLPVSGNKEELVQRLASYNMSEQKDNDDDLDDKLLEDDGLDLLESTGEEELDEKILSTSLNQPTSLSQSLSPVKKPAPSVVSAAPVTENLSPKETTTSETKDKKSEATSKPTIPVTSPKPISQVLEERKKRFSTEDKLEKRAQKFGLSTTPKESDLEVLKERAERFGVAVDAKPTKIDDKDALEKRKLRFGSSNIAAAAASTPALSAEVIDEKKKQRAERFGIPASKTDSSTIDNIDAILKKKTTATVGNADSISDKKRKYHTRQHRRYSKKETYTGW